MVILKTLKILNLQPLERDRNNHVQRILTRFLITSTEIKTYGIAWNGEIIGAESVLSETLSEEFTTKIKHLKSIKMFGCMLYDCADCQPQITQFYTITSYKQTYSIVSFSI